MKRVKKRWPVAALLLMLLGLLAGGTKEAQAGCQEAILIWSWPHMDWICSTSDGGGQVCILCSGPGNGPRQPT